MKVRWLVMLLSANTGGWTGLVTVLGKADSRALAFYRKAVDGRLTTLTPHTETFRTTVTSTGIAGFEGVVEGQLLSPCELEPAPDIAFIEDMFSVEFNRENSKHFVKTWEEECKSRLHGLRQENKNVWIGVMLGIVAHPTKYLCHKDECKDGGMINQINFSSGNTVERVWEYAFSKPEALKNNYRLRSDFFKDIGQLLVEEKSGGRRCENIYGNGGDKYKNCKEFVDRFKDKKEDPRELCKTVTEIGSVEQIESSCFRWVKNWSDKTKLYLLEKQSEISKKYTEQSWWERSDREGRKSGQRNEDEVAFWWWWGADPENQGVQGGDREKLNKREEVRKYWENALGAEETCIPVPTMLRKSLTGTNFDMTIEAIPV